MKKRISRVIFTLFVVFCNEVRQPPLCNSSSFELNASLIFFCCLYKAGKQSKQERAKEKVGREGKWIRDKYVETGVRNTRGNHGQEWDAKRGERGSRGAGLRAAEAPLEARGQEAGSLLPSSLLPAPPHSTPRR